MPNVADRLLGATSTLGCKAPVQAATTAEITLSGEQTVDGVSLTEGDRCLVKDQSDETENGIYEVATSAWSLAKDFDGTGDWRKGTIIPVAAGTANAGTVWRVSSADPDSIGEDNVTFAQLDFTSVEVSGSVATGSSVNLNSVDAEIVGITGSGATIATITLTDGRSKIVRFEGANTLTHSSNLVLPGAQNITTAAGDFAFFCGYGSSVVRCAFFQRGTSQPLVTGSATIASAATVDLGAVREQLIRISGSVSITSFGTAADTGTIKFVTLNSAPLLTNSANLICPDASDIQGASGDSFIAKYEGSSVWRVVNYTRSAKIVHVDVTDVSTAALTESDLMSYTMPAGRMSYRGAAVEVLAWGITSTATTAATRRMRLYFGATVVTESGAVALVGGKWRMSAVIAREDATNQSASGLTIYSTGAIGVAGSSMSIDAASPTETLGSTFAIKVTGLCTGATGIITQHGLIVRHLTP